MRKRLYEIVSPPNEGDLVSKVFDIFIIALIVINAVFVVMDTFDIPEWLESVSAVVEKTSLVIFTVEYVLRLITADYDYPGSQKPVALVKHVFSFYALIDLAAILPFLLPLVFPIDLRILRVLRVFRLLRLFKFNRYTDAMSVITRAFVSKKHELLSSFFIVALLMVVASVLMFSFENEAQPDAFSNALDALWWALLTLTSVGSDVSPSTTEGQVLSSIIAFLGIIIVAVPTGILSAAFTEEIEEKAAAKQAAKEKESKSKHFCPYCGEKLDE